MMGAEQKMKFIGCSIDEVFSRGTSVSEVFLPLLSSEYVVFPGFCDVHVHFREPGFSYKETIYSGCMAAAAGGFTDVCTMPNLNPVPDNFQHLQMQQDLIQKQANIHVYPYGAISVGEQGIELADLEAMASMVIAFSDDGRGVQDREMMRQAMVRAKKLGKMIVAHCEVNSLLRGGYIHDGEYAALHQHKGICSRSEYEQIERDLHLAEETGCAYHVCHISTKESVELIRQAKKKGIDVTCETAPHYLVLDDSFLEEDGRFKMNPPLRSKEDRQALICGIQDGTIDMIATDHAPHSLEEKTKGLACSAFGVVGLETAFSVLYTKLVKNNVISLQQLVELMSLNPRKRFSIPESQSYCIWDLNNFFVVDPQQFYSKGKSTPFAGWPLQGKCIMTICDGNVVYKKGTEK